MPDVAYFEAVAQLIPVLCIVVIVERYTHGNRDGAEHDVWFAFGTLGALFSFTNGEIAALGAIASQAPTQTQTVAATLGLALGGTLLILTPFVTSLDRTLDHYSDNPSKKLPRGTSWLVPIVGIVVCLLPFVVAVIWLFTLFYV